MPGMASPNPTRPPARRVAVIGAGPCGLTAIKACLEEGLEPVCFEKTHTVGGLWYYREDRTEQSCVFRSTVINTSKETMCFSDFPIPKDWPNYLHNRKVLEYFRMYADHFGLKNYINFKTKVNMISPASDFDATGRWLISLTDIGNGTAREETFDAVLVCSGHHCTPNIPYFEGLSTFKGEVIHTHDYTTPEQHREKRIVVIGIGNSGGDAAVELGRMASRLYLSTRSGAWVKYRLSDHCYPGDLVNRVFRSFPISWTERMLISKSKKRVDHKLLGIQPDFGFTAAHPLVNDDLPGCIMNGWVTIKPNVARFTTTGVVFEDGSVEEDIDLIVFATGYKIQFPFIPQSVLPVHDNEVEMYRYVFNPRHRHPTMAVLGMIQPLGPTFTPAELQARWATRVFKGKSHLPSEDEMVVDIRRKKEAMAKRYKKSPRHTIQIDILPYMDDIAREIGAKPNWLRLLLTDPLLAYHIMFGPLVPAQYRVHGPHSWSGARRHIMTVWERIAFPYKARQGGNQTMTELERQRVRRSSSWFRFLRLFVLFGAFASCYVYFYRRKSVAGNLKEMLPAFITRYIT